VLFDMASQKRIKKLQLGFVPDLQLPSFCEALLKFTSLEHLSLTSLNLSRINEQVFFEFIKTSNLRVLHLIKIEASSQFATLLKSIRMSRNIRELKLADIPIQIEHRFDRLKAYLDSSANILKRLSLQTNKLNSLDFLANMQELNLEQLEVIDQCIEKEAEKVHDPEESLSFDSTSNKALTQLVKNKTLRKFKLSRGYIKSVKPLVKCFYSFINLEKLEISHIELSRLHFMAIDNFIVGN
jgi:hypothetical protein